MLFNKWILFLSLLIYKQGLPSVENIHKNIRVSWNGGMLFTRISPEGVPWLLNPNNKTKWEYIFLKVYYILKWISTKIVFKKMDFIFSPVNIQTRVT